MNEVKKISSWMKKASRIVFVGLGSSSLVAADAFYKFSKLGLPVSVCQDPYSISIVGAHSKKDELFFAISHTGETREIVNCLNLAKENGSRTVAISSFSHSKVSKCVDILLSSATNEVKYLPDATISRLVQMVIVDILYVDVMLLTLPESGDKLKASRIAIAQSKL